jgi:hypothetical protein
VRSRRVGGAIRERGMKARRHVPRHRSMTKLLCVADGQNKSVLVLGPIEDLGGGHWTDGR